MQRSLFLPRRLTPSVTDASPACLTALELVVKTVDFVSGKRNDETSREFRESKGGMDQTVNHPSRETDILIVFLTLGPIGALNTPSGPRAIASAAPSKGIESK